MKEQMPRIMRASELQSVIGRIITIRYASEIAQYEKDLAAYECALKRGKKELTETTRGYFGASEERTLYQVVKTENGVKSIENVYRPMKPQWIPWSYTGYDRFMGMSSHARQSGVLANPEVNREILPRRVEGYQAQMQAGLWRDLLSDPITITADGHAERPASSGRCLLRRLGEGRQRPALPRRLRRRPGRGDPRRHLDEAHGQ